MPYFQRPNHVPEDRAAGSTDYVWTRVYGAPDRLEKGLRLSASQTEMRRYDTVLAPG